ncbi:MAG: VOC family protein [Caulobacteraceae bacterium]|nr:VOC family protein [Caulobacteraceae bacterium]
MAKVVGLGGVFIKAPDVEAWRAWYHRVLGVSFEEFGAAIFKHPAVGCTNLSPFAADTAYFEPSAQPFMINLIVDDIDGVLALAAKAGEEPVGRQDEDYGRFAWLVDPAGVKVELWQPLGPSPV